jgi:hypothetical protein
MTLKDYKKMLEADVPNLDQSDLENESARSFQLWNKYHFLYLEEYRILTDLEHELNALRMNRWLYYQGKATTPEYKEKPYDLKHMKTEAKEFMEVDPDVVKLKKAYQEQERIVTHLKTATAEIARRSYYIADATKNIQWHNARPSS